MAYATQADLETRYGADAVLTAADRDGDGTADAAAIERALSGASEEIDGYLAKRYALPLAEVPGLVRDLCERLAFARLHTFTVPEAVQAEADKARRTLKDISDGTVELSLAGKAPAAAGGGPEVAGPDRVFSRDTLKGF
jgi:phage gp36-like protein